MPMNVYVVNQAIIKCIRERWVLGSLLPLTPPPKSLGMRLPIMVTIEVNGQQLPMKVDTSATVSVISTETKTKPLPKCLLNSTSPY